MYVVMRVQNFKVEPVGAFPIPVSIDPGKMKGYLPVYATREDALADFPNAELVEIKEHND